MSFSRDLVKSRHETVTVHQVALRTAISSPPPGPATAGSYHTMLLSPFNLFKDSFATAKEKTGILRMFL